MTQKEKIERIERKIGITLGVKDGKPYFGGFLNLRGIGITALPEGLTVGGHLDLRETGITALPEGLTVGGYLDLEGCTSITALPGGLTVGGNLDLRGTSITALPEGLTVGGNLDLRGTSITDTTKVRRELTAEQRGKINAVVNRVIEWQWNGRHYIKADDEFTVVDAHRGNVYRVHYLGKSEQLYLVTDGEGHWAHGKTLREAKDDLLYKVSDRDVSAYKGLPLDTELPFSELVAMYRTITGACAAGTRNFVENRLPQPRKDRYTIAEMLRLTEGEYGSDRIKEFFSV